MRASIFIPFRRLTKPKSVDRAGNLKAGFVLLFTGFCSHILFFEVLVLLLKLEMNYIQNLLFLGITGLPEIDILTPLILISLSPIFLIFTNPVLFLISELPWVFAGFLTGLLFGPQHDRSIMFAPPIFVSSIMMLFFFLLFSITGLGQSMPSTGIIFLVSLMLLLIVVLGQAILMFSMIMVIPALFGYFLGKKYTLRAISPQVFLAQPDRQDPNHTRCQFLSPQNYCDVSGREGLFIHNTCDNKWNQVTCSFFIRQVRIKKVTEKTQQGDFINEI
jgi:hypothetical protein